jgi:hypothetical protein
MRAREIAFAFALCVGSSFAGCSVNQGNYWAPPLDAGMTSQVVGSGGGTVTADDGTTVTIPPGALSQDTTITITPNALAPTLTQATQLNVAHLFGPEGQHFSKEITVTLEFDPSKLPPGATPAGISVWSAPSDTNFYQTLSTTVADSTHVIGKTADFCNMVPGANGSGGTVVVSDRNLKRDIEPVDEQAVLERVASMPVSTWSYKSEDRSVRHLGPMAQDFSAAFGLGDTDRAYSSVDAHGVAMAAIKALYERSREQDARIERLERENAELRENAAQRRGGLCSQ